MSRHPRTTRVLAFAALLLLTGCAHRIGAAVEPGSPGFFWGLWNGWTAAFSFIGSLFSDDIAIYAVPNNGGWYDFGFVLGAGLFLGGGSAAARR